MKLHLGAMASLSLLLASCVSQQEAASDTAASDASLTSCPTWEDVREGNWPGFETIYTKESEYGSVTGFRQVFRDAGVKEGTTDIACRYHAQTATSLTVVLTKTVLGSVEVDEAIWKTSGSGMSCSAEIAAGCPWSVV